MSPNEKQNGSFLENREYQNQNQNTANENAVVKEEGYENGDLRNQNDDFADRNDYSPMNPNPDQTTNDEDDFLNLDYPDKKDGDEDEDDLVEEDEEEDDFVDEEDQEEDDFEEEDLEDEAENSVDQSREDFNETENQFLGHPEEEYNEEDFQTEFPEQDSRRFSHFRV